MTFAQQSLTLHLFGAGGAFSRRYGTTCSMLALPDGKRWLIDCGRQAPDQIYAAGLHWHDFEGQIVTHVHGDHVYGLEDFAFVRFFESHGEHKPTREGGAIPKMIAHSAVLAEVWETLAPSLRYLREGGSLTAGTLAHYFEVLAARASEPPRQNPWNHAEVFDSGLLGLVARETEHVPGKPACALEIRVSGDPDDPRIAWWSGDSTVDIDILSAIEPRTTVFFHDCTFVDYPGQVHGYFDLLEALPERVRRKMVIMHHEDNLEENRAKVEAAGLRIALSGHSYDLGSGQRIA
ncbi:MAG: MBL fold metallo-hydrolase [Nannocystis sp.]|nr:MBL fold metallo-hydrolase [Nannocystis sp.]